MRRISKDGLIASVKNYIEGEHQKPMLIWFHSNRDIDDARNRLKKEDGCAKFSVNTLMDNPEIFEPGDATKFFLYHSYLNQFDEKKIAFCFKLFDEQRKPLIMLVNDYETPDEGIDTSRYDECDYPMVLSDRDIDTKYTKINKEKAESLERT